MASGPTDSDPAMVRNGGRPSGAPIAEGQGSVDADPVAEAQGERAPAPAGVKGSPTEGAADGETNRRQMAQFQLPAATPEGSAPPQSDEGFTTRRRLPEAQPTPFPGILRFQYGIDSESDITYRRDPDLDERARDNSLLLAPQVGGYFLYRPTDWLETAMEIILEREIAAQEEEIVTLPNGETQVAPARSFSLLIDQAYLSVGRASQPVRFTVGRRNFEDDRHWLYDTSLDVALVRFKYGYFQAEASVGREELVDLDLLQRVPNGRIDNYMWYMTYRGVEDIRLASYAIFRNDRAGPEGQPLHLGVSALGTPSDSWRYWVELAYVTGKDGSNRTLSGYGLDVGGVYRFTDLPLYPSITLGWAFGTGDGDPDDRVNHEFRQTGLQSNETRFAGVAKFKVYGEALDPELSNLKIFTVGLGFRPARNMFVELIYHRYWLDKIADELRNSALTAQMNQVETRLSKDVGSGVDIVLGFRNVFGLRRLGLDVRAGWFFPGEAFLRSEGDEENPNLRHADTGFVMVAKFWW